MRQVRSLGERCALHVVIRHRTAPPAPAPSSEAGRGLPAHTVAPAITLLLPWPAPCKQEVGHQLKPAGLRSAAMYARREGTEALSTFTGKSPLSCLTPYGVMGRSQATCTGTSGGPT